MEKTFREVIATIKDGEVWVNTISNYVTKKIRCIDGKIVIVLAQSRSSFGSDGIFVLERKEYTFEEAFKAYEEGKEIESICEYKYKKSNGVDCMYSKHLGQFIESHDGIYIKEIRGKWYIND